MKDNLFTAQDRLFVLDGYGYVFRAYYALPPLKRRSDDMSIGAVAGFCNMVFRLLLDEAQSQSFAKMGRYNLGCVALDTAAPTFRQDMYPAYKANRKEAPEDLKLQLPLIREAITAFGLHAIEYQGYEADDIMASLAKQAHKASMPLMLLSSDKDLMQLIGGCVNMYDPVKALSITEEEVYKKFGVPPEKVIDVQALIGDSSDNIPGVPGIGIKTAASLIQKYGSLHDLLHKTHTIEQDKRRALLEQYKDQALLSQKLATLYTDLSFDIDKTQLEIKRPDMDNLAEFFKRMEFNTLTKRAQKIYGDDFSSAYAKVSEQKVIYTPSAPVDTTQETANNNALERTPLKHYQSVLRDMQTIAFNREAYQCITKKQDFQDMLQCVKQQDIVALDTETTGLNSLQDELVGISLAWKPGEACYIPLRHCKTHAESKESKQASLYQQQEDMYLEDQLDINYVIEALKEVFLTQHMIVVGHNIKFDQQVLQRYGLNLTYVHDTMLMSYALHAGKHAHNMDYLSQTYLLHTPMHFVDIVGSGKNKKIFSHIDLVTATQYAAEDADITLRLYHCLQTKLVAESKYEVYMTLERPLIEVLVMCESAGVMVDLTFLRTLSLDFHKKLQAQEDKVYALAGERFNIASPKQLGYILFDKLGLSSDKKTRSGNAATGAAILERLSVEGHGIAKEILQWRHYAKLISTYTDALPSHVNPTTKRVHTSYSLAATITGRLASTQPNLQNIPIRTEEGRAIRNAFIAPPGYVLIGADYSQIELRLFAHIAKIDSLVKAFHNGQDIHAMTASELFNQPIENMDPMIRRRAKAINFGIIYGISAFGLAAQLNISQKEARDYLNIYFERFSGIKQYMDDTIRMAQENGYVETIFGRRCYYVLMQSGSAAQQSLYKRAAINAPIQGSAADIIRRAMIRLHCAIAQQDIELRLLLQVHDELLFEVREDQAEKASALIKTVMEEAHLPRVILEVPLVVDVNQGQNWGEVH